MSPSIRHPQVLFIFLTSIFLSSTPKILADYPPASAHGHSFYQAPNSGGLGGGAGGGGYVYDDYYAPAGLQNGSHYSPYIHGSSKCVPIPSSLTLCRDIGYSEMRLPNLLQHDTMGEVQQQSSSWLQLLRVQCHPDTQIFLCSLFAPVCLTQPIWPCRSLCESVRSGCEDRMLKYGYPWPDMLKCDQLPTDDQLCIQLRSNRTGEIDRNCPECSALENYQDIVDSMCQASFVMRVQIDEMLVNGPDVKVVVTKKRRILKAGPVPRKILRTAEIFIEGGAHCDCPPTEVKGRQGGRGKDPHYLVMGVKDGLGRLQINRLYLIDKNSKDMKRALKLLRKQQTSTSQNKVGQVSGSSGSANQKKGGQISGSERGANKDMCSRMGNGGSNSNIYGPSVIVDSVDNRHAIIGMGEELDPGWLDQNPNGEANGKKNSGNKNKKNNRNKNKKKKETRRKRKLEERIAEESLRRNQRVRRSFLSSILEGSSSAKQNV